MSRKNNKSRKNTQHDFERQREAERKQKQDEKRQRKLQNKEGAMQTDGGVKKQRKKGIKIRKHVVIKGIKIKDSDSKKEALARLKAEQAMAMVE